MHSQLLGMRVRLDANASFSADQFKEFAHSLNPSVRSTIEFIEDPTDSPTEWRALRTELMLPFAFDRGAWPENPTDAFDWVVIKPAIQNPARVASQAKLYGINMCVTSYLDHPVGQMGAALEAARLVRQSMNVGTCGLLSHSAYEASDFSMALQTRGPELMPSSDIGIGFTDLLENLQWERL
jgi:O-succinylbenzoate synthase